MARRLSAGVLHLTSNLQRDRALSFSARRGYEYTHAGLNLVLR